MLMEATEMPPVPMYQPLVPFYPSLVNGDSSSSSSNVAASAVANGDAAKWKIYPDRLDIYAWQGDDVQVTFYFQYPEEPDPDMSAYEWWAQMRLMHAYRSTLITEFSIQATYTAANPDDPDDLTATVTKVGVFLPRQNNDQAGLFHWELASKGPYDWTGFSKPPDVAVEDWPPVDTLKTWIYGYVYIVPRLTSTDFLPTPPGSVSNGGTVVVTSTGITVGPNGRVP
jgi:hypothetical protein